MRRLRYFYGSTSLEGSSFEYHGRPIAILKGRLIAVLGYAVFVIGARVDSRFGILLFPVFLFGMPWIIMRARLFQMRMTSWRGLRFNFLGTYGGALGAFVGWPLLALLTLGALYPFALWKQVRYVLGNSAYGTQRFAFLTRIGRFYRFCLIGSAIAIGVLCVVVALTAGASVSGAAAQAMMTPDANPADVLRRMLSGRAVLGVLVYGAALTLIIAWFRANLVNASLGGTRIGPHQLYSRMRTWPLFAILLTNLLGMIVTLGLYYPWAKVRAMRYQLDNTGVIAAGDLDQFIAASGLSADAIGEEVGDFLDIDFGF